MLVENDRIGLTPKGYQRLLNNQAVLSHQLVNLDTTALAAAAAHGAAEVKVNAKLVASAAELSVQAQPLLHAIQQQTQLLQQQNQRLDAIQANQDKCGCAIM